MSDRATREAYHDSVLDDRERRTPDRETHQQLVPTGEPGAGSAESMKASEAGVHPIITKIAIGAAVWFLAVTWLAFAWGGETDFLLAIVILFFAMFFTLFLLTASYSVKDARWPVRDTSFHEFLGSEIGISGGTMSGRDVLFETALIPVALAFAATLIGLAWVIFG